MKFKTLVFFSIFSILFFAGCDSKDDKKQDIQPSNNSQSQFNLNTLKNIPIEIGFSDNKLILKDSNNKLVLVNFFATWCPACKVQIPNLVKLQDDFQNDLVVVGILLEEFKSNEEILSALKEYNVNYSVTNAVEGFDLAKTLGGLKSIPTSFLVDKEGNIFQKYVGIVPNEMLEIDIKKLLEK
ncbi:TlpA family protein disulfide reductase [Aliarcobacter vitoriensis]|uniref:Thioredoxin n=1 Tax=Aliarcobacter vitoriensis TaxID=2011099 RepID=A0A366MRN6_9BACT|nr:TlpA disulfide reductase family protein [Aliarcobacter vitoriensis]RBQ28513.1 thioredoxin [Aliarcobacter vitoriensis]RBQ32071.1 thioredoxin [Arcobacter sp. FW59]